MLSEKLKELRESRKLTKKQMAKDLELQYMTYCHYESGNREPNNATLNRIADYFNVPIDYLIGNTLCLEFYPREYACASIKCPVCDCERVHFVRCIGVDFNNSCSIGCALEFKCQLGHTFYSVYETYNLSTYNVKFDTNTATICDGKDDEVLYDGGFTTMSEEVFAELEVHDFKKKYYRLDKFGKKAIKKLLEIEYERCCSAETEYPLRSAARNGVSPSIETMTQAEIDEIESMPDL